MSRIKFAATASTPFVPSASPHSCFPREPISRNKTRQRKLNKENRSSSRNLRRKHKTPPRREANALSSAITLVAPARRRRPIAVGDVNATLSQSGQASPWALSVAAPGCEFLLGCEGGQKFLVRRKPNKFVVSLVKCCVAPANLRFAPVPTVGLQASGRPVPAAQLFTAAKPSRRIRRGSPTSKRSLLALCRFGAAQNKQRAPGDALATPVRTALLKNGATSRFSQS